MSDSNALHSNTPAVLGGDLPEKEQLAVEEGHDADIPTSKGADNVPEQQHDTIGETRSISETKDDRHSSVSASSHGGSNTNDVEKNAAEATAEETDEPRDPNIVDWDGP